MPAMGTTKSEPKSFTHRKCCRLKATLTLINFPIMVGRQPCDHVNADGIVGKYLSYEVREPGSNPVGTRPFPHFSDFFSLFTVILNERTYLSIICLSFVFLFVNKFNCTRNMSIT